VNSNLLEVVNLGIQQGKFALDGITLRVPTGSYGVLMGRTGCGKTSILEVIAGLRRAHSGEVLLGGRDVTFLPPAHRDVGYVPQDGALFPTMTVAEQLGFALLVRRAPRNEIERRVQELAEWLEITPLLDRRPQGLSGGEAQRVALGRALSFRPRFLLMDEPLSSLDEATHGHLVRLLQQIREKRDVTVLHVTHSSREAGDLADVMFRLEDGRLVEGGR